MHQDATKCLGAAQQDISMIEKNSMADV